MKIEKMVLKRTMYKYLMLSADRKQWLEHNLSLNFNFSLYLAL